MGESGIPLVGEVGSLLDGDSGTDEDILGEDAESSLELLKKTYYH